MSYHSFLQRSCNYSGHTPVYFKQVSDYEYESCVSHRESAGLTCILLLHLHSLLLLPAESISRRPFRHLDVNREATDPEVRRGGHDCTIGLGLLAELKTTAVVCIHVEQAWQQPTCNEDLNLRFSAL